MKTLRISDELTLPTGDALRAYLLERLSGGERVIFEAVTRAYPEPLDREALGEMTEYRRSSRDTYLQKLAARRLITTERGSVRASDMLFG